jgi:tetratricopeptide (TPR) repeat protein
MHSARCLDVSRLQTLTNAIAASQAALDAWHKIIAMVGGNWRPSPERGTDPELRYLRTIVRVRTDPLEASERRLAELVAAQPTAFHAVEEHGSILDRLGQRDAARAEYESARRRRQLIRRGMPDRPFFTRHRTTSVAEIDGYTKVLRAGASNKGIFPYVARGHAYLTTRRPRLALLDYDEALKRAPQESGLLVARGEALAALGRHREALQALDQAVASRPQDPEALSSRAFVLLALGRVAEADADWLRQLELMPRERHDVRACVALRLANYDMALVELESAIGRNPADPYMQLYFLTSLRRLGRSVQPRVDPVTVWPGPLIALHDGKLCPSEVLAAADNPERRAEALFQLGIWSYDHDRAEAGRLWRQAAEIAAPDTIEHAAARHEIERLRIDPPPISLGRATEKETNKMAISK